MARDVVVLVHGLPLVRCGLERGSAEPVGVGDIDLEPLVRSKTLRPSPELETGRTSMPAVYVRGEAYRRLHRRRPGLLALRWASAHRRRSIASCLSTWARFSAYSTASRPSAGLSTLEVDARRGGFSWLSFGPRICGKRGRHLCWSRARGPARTVPSASDHARRLGIPGAQQRLERRWRRDRPEVALFGGLPQKDLKCPRRGCRSRPRRPRRRRRRRSARRRNPRRGGPSGPATPAARRVVGAGAVRPKTSKRAEGGAGAGAGADEEVRRAASTRPAPLRTAATARPPA